ncbi:MAG: response regulator [Pseudomonadota bacterium]
MNDTNERARVLVVDDEPVSLALVAGILEEDYQVLAGAGDGEEALGRIRAEKPDLVLTDIVMPGMSGFELCRALKEDGQTRDIPVLFLSGAMSLEEYLNGHDAGGDDFLAKPFQPGALRLTVAHTLRNAAERRRLAQDAQSAFSTAMVAMSSAAEIGVVLNFIRSSYACREYVQLADAVVTACGEFGLSACVRLHGRMGGLARNRSGASSALERSILERLAGFGRIVDFSHRTAISYDHVTLMITDMPRDNEERYGRLRDHLAMLVESADARVQALDDSLEITAKHRTLTGLVRQTQAALADIDRRHRDNQNDTRLIMHAMLGTVEQSFAQLGLTTAQEDYLAGVLRGAVEQVMDLFNQGLAIDDHLTAVKNMLDKEDGAATAPLH